MHFTWTAEQLNKLERAKIKLNYNDVTQKDLKNYLYLELAGTLIQDLLNGNVDYEDITLEDKHFRTNLFTVDDYLFVLLYVNEEDLNTSDYPTIDISFEYVDDGKKPEFDGSWNYTVRDIIGI